MSQSNARRSLLAACLLGALCSSLPACGGQDDRAATTTGTSEPVSVSYESATADLPPPPKAERRQSAEERRVGSLALRLQRLVASKNYDTACALLSSAASKQAESSSHHCCSKGLRAAARTAVDRQPEIAWVRLRGSWGSVVVRKPPNGQLALTIVDKDRGRWRFPDLGVAGIDWP